MVKGFICGVFDLFHYGHILALRECREHCGHLTVAINAAGNIDEKINPGKNRPVYSLKERVEIMKECRLVDEVLVYDSEDSLSELLRKGNYDVRFLGDDYRGMPITGSDLCGRIHYLDRSHGLSTSDYRRRIRGGS